MHEIFLPCHNKPEFAYGIFNYHFHSMFLRACRLRLAKKIDKLSWFHVLYKVNDMFRYCNFFYLSFLSKFKYNWRSSWGKRICSFRFHLALFE